MENILSDKIKFMKNASMNNKNTDEILKQIYNVIDQNEDLIKEAYELDREFSNRKENLKFKRILDNIEGIINYTIKENDVYQNFDERRVLGINQNMGVIGVFGDGDIFLTIDLICKALKTNNAIIFELDMYKNAGTNNLIINMVKDILENNNKSRELVEINLSDNSTLVNENINLAIVVGDKIKQEEISKKLHCKIINSGYGYNEIYIESTEDEVFIKSIKNVEDNNVKYYIKEGINTNIEGEIVKNINEAINKINENGAGYATSIFTEDEENARKFIKEVKNKYAFVKASPTLVRDSDININDLYYKKICMV